LLLWLALNGVAALPLVADPLARFKVFLNPFAPPLVVILEVLIVLVSALRYRRLADLVVSGKNNSRVAPFGYLAS
jgi:hypothetical protein